MSLNDSIKMLLEQACPSIQYRVRRDILEQPTDNAEMKELQGQILMDPKVKEVMAWQHSDGWLGGPFHGDCEPETAIRLLMEKGVENTNPVITACLKALLERGAAFDKGSLERVGKLLDASHLGGSQMIKACVFAYAGQEEYDFVDQQIKESLYGFASTLTIDDTKQLYHLHKGKTPVFNQGMVWPSIYHLRLLAFTNRWRTAENLQLVCDAINHMLCLCPLVEIKLLHKGQIISPAQMDFINLFATPMDALSPKEWMQWFHRAELVARLGLAGRLPVIDQQLQYLLEELKSNDWRFSKALSHYHFHKWSAYTGLALQQSWKSKTSRIFDLTFRSLLLMKYTNQLSQAGRCES